MLIWDRSFLPKVIIALAVVGLVVMVRLFIAHIHGGGLACTPLEGCNVVISSPYAYLFGVPLSLLRVIFYAIVLAIGIAMLTRHAILAQKFFYVAAVVGILLSFCVPCIQAFLVGAWCIYCVVSATICVIFAAIALWMWRGVSSR